MGKRQNKELEILSNRGREPITKNSLRKEERRLKKFHHIEYYIKLLEIEKDELVLDLCCGSGYFDLKLKERGCVIICIDLAPRNILIAKKLFKKYRLEGLFIIGDGEKIPLKKNLIDRVIIKESLHHLPCISKLEKQVYTTLKKNGKLIAVEPNPRNPLIFLKREGDMYSPNEIYHPISVYEKHFEKFSKLNIYTTRFLPNTTKFDKFLSKIPLLNRLGSKIVIKAQK